MSNIYGKGPKGKATRLHALIIRAHGSCVKCGNDHTLQCAHIISRKYSWTRTDLDNAFCLCASCHAYFTDHPVDFGQFTIDQIGDENYTALLRKRQSTDKVDWDAEAKRLEEIARDRGLM
jgi:predicted restriction endonuclease